MDDFEARRDGVEQLHRLAASVAEELAGLDLESAKLRVAAHPGVVVRFAFHSHHKLEPGRAAAGATVE